MREDISAVLFATEKKNNFCLLMQVCTPIEFTQKIKSTIYMY